MEINHRRKPEEEEEIYEETHLKESGREENDLEKEATSTGHRLKKYESERRNSKERFSKNGGESSNDEKMTKKESWVIEMKKK